MAICNHCYFDVMFKADDTCPACGRSQEAVSAVAQDKTLLVISIGQAMPACCIACGDDTQHTQRFAFWYDVVESKTLFTRFMARLPGNERRKAQRVVLPVCNTCFTHGAKNIVPLSIRLDLDYRMVVHKNFRIKFEELNGPVLAERT